MATLDLIPRNDEALRIVTDAVNGPFLRLTGAGDVVISLPLDNISKTKGNLVTFGRDQSVCDVYLGSSKYYAKTHCFIYVHPVSGEFVLQDVSSSQSADLWVEGEDSGRFNLQGAPRRRVLATSRCTIFGIRQAAFQLSWCGRQSDVQQAKMRRAAQLDHLARTSVERESVLPPQPGTRVQPPPAHGVQLLRKIDHQPRGDLGSGSYGKVKLTVNLDSGDLLAVKQFPIHPELEKQQKEKVKHEVLLLSKLSHPNIAVFVHSQGWAAGELVELFMKPCDGTLRNLLDRSPPDFSEPYYYRTLQFQMLQALVYLQEKKIVHCDLKPENILQNENGKDFYLADFGLSNDLAHVHTGCGTRKYMSPESFGKTKVGTMSDVWSLGVVLYEVLYGLPGWNSQWHETVMGLAKISGRLEILPMLIENPKERYDAKKCLLQYSTSTSWTAAPSSSSAGPSTARPGQAPSLPPGPSQPRGSAAPRPPLQGLAQPRNLTVRAVYSKPPGPPLPQGQPAGSRQPPQQLRQQPLPRPSQPMLPGQATGSSQIPQQLRQQPLPGPSQPMPQGQPAGSSQIPRQFRQRPPPEPNQPVPTGGRSSEAAAHVVPDMPNPFGSQAGLEPQNANPPVTQPQQRSPARAQRLTGEKRNAEPNPDQYPQQVASAHQQRKPTDESRHKPRTRTDQ